MIAGFKDNAPALLDVVEPIEAHLALSRILQRISRTPQPRRAHSELCLACLVAPASPNISTGYSSAVMNGGNHANRSMIVVTMVMTGQMPMFVLDN